MKAKLLAIIMGLALVGCGSDTTPVPEGSGNTLDNQTVVQDQTEDLAEDQADQKTDADVAPYAPDLYLRGEMVGWGANDGARFSYVGDNKYELIFPLDAKSYEFKVADDKWTNGSNFGTDAKFDLEKPVAMQNGGGNIVFAFPKSSYYLFVLDATTPGSPTLYVSPVEYVDTPPYGDSLTADGLDGAAFSYLGKGVYQYAQTLSPGQYSIDLGIALGSADPVAVNGVVALDAAVDSIKFDLVENGFYKLTLDASELDNAQFSVEYLGKPTAVTIHYQRCVPDYEGWEVHSWGASLTQEQMTDWGDNPEFSTSGIASAFGYDLVMEVSFDIQPFEFLIHKNGNKDVNVNRKIIPAESSEVWVRQNDPSMYLIQPTGENEFCLPKAVAGNDVFTTADYAVTLSSAGSEVAKTYLWEVTSKPEGSATEIISPDAITTLFKADTLGEYEITLTINSGTDKEAIDAVLVSVTELQKAKNIILMIGDGMGYEQIKAAGYYLGSSLSFESMPYQGEVQTASASSIGREHDSSFYTDSAAASTAMATGNKVTSGVISVAEPGDGHELESILEVFQSFGKSVGLVSTNFITDATPAGFGAHELNRQNTAEIAADYLSQTRPDLLLGGGGNGMTKQLAENYGYDVVTTTSEMNAAVAAVTDNNFKISGQFNDDHMPYESEDLGDWPHLSQMVGAALDALEHSQKGFFLMVEGARIDHAGHANHSTNAVLETVEFANAAQIVMDWAEGRDDTLVIVTADHETGGLRVLEDLGAGNIPSMTWSTGKHTAKNVPVFATGVNAEFIHEKVIDNTDVFHLMQSTVH